MRTASARSSPSYSLSGTTSPDSRETGSSNRGSFASELFAALALTASAMEMRRRVTSALSEASCSGASWFAAPNASAATFTFCPSRISKSARVSPTYTGIARIGSSSSAEAPADASASAVRANAARTPRGAKIIVVVATGGSTTVTTRDAPRGVAEARAGRARKERAIEDGRRAKRRGRRARCGGRRSIARRGSSAPARASTVLDEQSARGNIDREHPRV